MTGLIGASNHKTPADRAIEAGTYTRQLVIRFGYVVGYIDVPVDPEQVTYGPIPPDPPRLLQVGDGCECWITPEEQWTRYGSAVEPGSQVEWNPDCPQHPANADGAPLR